MKTEVLVSAAPRARPRLPLSPMGIRVLSVVVGLGAWEAYGQILRSPIFTYPSAIARAGLILVQTGELQYYLQASLVVLSLGLLLAILFGIPFGVAIARSTLLEHATDPYINALYATPTVALIPVVVLWLGFQTTAKVALVFLFCVFPILINTYQGVRSVDRRLVEVARSFCSREWALWRDVILPSATPFILAGVRLAIGRGLVGMVVADLYTAVSGIGYLIVRYAQNMQVDRMLVPVVTLSLLGVLLTRGLRWLEGRLAPWLQAEQP